MTKLDRAHDRVRQRAHERPLKHPMTRHGFLISVGRYDQRIATVKETTPSLTILSADHGRLMTSLISTVMNTTRASSRTVV